MPAPDATEDIALEIRCLCGVLSTDLLIDATRRAAAVGTGADTVLITAGAIDGDMFARRLAAHLGLPYLDLRHVTLDDLGGTADRLAESVTAGVLTVRTSRGRRLVVAPQGYDSRRLVENVTRFPETRRRLAVTSRAAMLDMATRLAARDLAMDATDALARRFPECAVRPGPQIGRRTWVITAMVVLTTALAAPAILLGTIETIAAFAFFGWAVLRLSGSVVGDQPRDPVRKQPADMLPVYSILVPLYREAASVSGLVAALGALDWPREKLDIKLLVEADDHETRRAIEALRLAPPFEVIVVAPEGPRTKPKALGVGLALARGAFVVVFDAEDQPEPDQLHRAHDAFLRGGPRLACVQARLTIDNTDDGWLTRLFTAEYASLFDVLLPMLAALRLPLPLGGTSNHFRTAVLHRVGGWDSRNVTEDLDLGMRLARLGWRTAVIPSSTWEEAPARMRAWIGQRSRWLKGWMMTWLVHMREPRRTLNELGLSGFVTFQILSLGTLLAALLHPIAMATLIHDAASGTLFATGPNPLLAALHALDAVVLVAGYLTSIIAGAIGLARRKLWGTMPWLLLTPVHWLLLSWAAWRALWELLRHPFNGPRPNMVSPGRRDAPDPLTLRRRREPPREHATWRRIAGGGLGRWRIDTRKHAEREREDRRPALTPRDEGVFR